MKTIIIVDGYNAGRQFAAAVSARKFKCFHVQSTEVPLSGFIKLPDESYNHNFVYRGDIAALVESITRLSEVEEIACVIAGS